MANHEKKQYTGKLMEIVWEMYIARTRGDVNVRLKNS